MRRKTRWLLNEAAHSYDGRAASLGDARAKSEGRKKERPVYSSASSRFHLLAPFRLCSSVHRHRGYRRRRWETRWSVEWEASPARRGDPVTSYHRPVPYAARGIYCRKAFHELRETKSTYRTPADDRWARGRDSWRRCLCSSLPSWSSRHRAAWRYREPERSLH
jgi:hypothetical protein